MFFPVCTAVNQVFRTIRFTFKLAVLDPREAVAGAECPIDGERIVVVKLDGFSGEEVELKEVTFGELTISYAGEYRR